MCSVVSVLEQRTLNGEEGTGQSCTGACPSCSLTERRVCPRTDAGACALLKQPRDSPAVSSGLAWKRHLLPLAGSASVHRNRTLGSPGTRARKHQRKIYTITSYSFHWEETKISHPSCTRQRERKRLATRLVWE